MLITKKYFVAKIYLKEIFFLSCAFQMSIVIINYIFFLYFLSI